MSSEMRYPSDRAPAPFLRRSAAFVIDAVVVGFIWFSSIVVAGIPGNRPEEGFDEPWDTIVEIIIVLLPAYWFVYHLVSNAIGVSVGKRMLSLSIEPAISSRSPVVRGLIRVIGQAIGVVPLGLGYWWTLWDRENRAWHDMLAGTRVVSRRSEDERLPGLAPPEVEVERPRPQVSGKNLRFVCEPWSPAAGVRWVEVRRDGVRFEDEHGLRGLRFEDIRAMRVLASGDVELRFMGLDPFGRPSEQTVRFTVHDREPFLAELQSRIASVTGMGLAVARG